MIVAIGAISARPGTTGPRVPQSDTGSWKVFVVAMPHPHFEGIRTPGFPRAIQVYSFDTNDEVLVRATGDAVDEHSQG
jgi:hypothetical protein